MHKTLLSSLFLTRALLAQQVAETTAPSANVDQAAKVDLAVLVTGIPDSDRLADYAGFLGKHFRKVGTASYSKFQADQADDYDVVLFDCEVRPRPGAIGLQPAPKLGADFKRASMMISGAGASLAGRQFESKINWH